MLRTYFYRVDLGDRTASGMIQAVNPYDAFCTIRLMPEYTSQIVKEIMIQNFDNGHIHYWHPSLG